MRAFAYCCVSFAESARRAAGVEPTTCPPVDDATFDPAWLIGCQFVYFDLHGETGKPYWAGDNGLFALRAETVRRANLKGAVVFASSCHLADESSPMLDALLSAGAEYVIGGAGVNYSGAASVFGAALLGLWVRRLLEINLAPLNALSYAKDRVVAALLAANILNDEERVKVNRDTLAFRAYYRKAAAV